MFAFFNKKKDFFGFAFNMVREKNFSIPGLVASAKAHAKKPFLLRKGEELYVGVQLDPETGRDANLKIMQKILPDMPADDLRCEIRMMEVDSISPL